MDPGPVRAFLVADVRGYTRYTREHGDRAAAELARRFAEIARAVVPAHAGEVVEVRGDEVLAVFASARGAVQAALALQEAYGGQVAGRHPEPPLPVGIGLDAGEAVPLDGGYRGAALNQAARLCAEAGAGEVLASPAVRDLAGVVDGARFGRERRLELSGLGRRRAVPVLPAPDAGSGARPPGVSWRRARPWVTVAAAGLIVVAIVTGPRWAGPLVDRLDPPAAQRGAAPDQEGVDPAASEPAKRAPVQVNVTPVPGGVWLLPGRAAALDPPAVGADCLAKPRLDWVRRAGGLPAGPAVLRITVVPSAQETVVVQDLRVVPSRRSLPSGPWTLLSLCPPTGGEAPVRFLSVDLGGPRPTVTYHRRDGTRVAPFAFTTAPGEAEVFQLQVIPPPGGTVDWRGELVLVVGGREVVVPVTDDGRAFAVTGVGHARVPVVAWPG